MTTTVKAKTFTLSAGVVAEVDLKYNYDLVEVASLDGAAEVYFTTNGADPTVGGDDCQVLDSGAPNSLLVEDETDNQTSVVKLISSGTPKVHVRGVRHGERTLGGATSGGGGTSSSVKVLDSGGTNTLSVSAGGAAKVDGSAITQPVSAASLPLPSGAATAAKQPALGTAGTASADVLSVQGVASMTALKVDGSAVTQPVSALAATRSAATTMQAAATASGNGTSLDVAGYPVALLNVVSSPSMSGGTTLNFEASVDDTTWVAIAAHTIGTNGSLATTATADGDYRIACAGYKSLRCRISAYSAGTITVKGYAQPTASQPTAVALATGTNSIGTVTANIGTSGSLALDATLTGGTQVAKVGDGTNTAHVLKADGTAAGQGAQLVAGTSLSVAFTTSTVQAVGQTDCFNYAWVAVQITSQGGSSTVAFQTSNDGTNWTAQYLQQVASSTIGSTITTTGVFVGHVCGRYFRLNVTGILSGTTAGTMVFSTSPRPLPNPGATQVGLWNVQQAAATTGGYSFTNLTANTAGTTVKSGAGTLRAVTVNSAGASSNVLTLYDGTSTGGTKIGTFDTNSLRTIPFDLAFATGLFAVLATGTAADLTILWK